MKIKTTTTEIECNAEELRQSNSLAEAFYGALRRSFNGPWSEDPEAEEAATEEEK